MNRNSIIGASIRPADIFDAAALADIYAPYVRDTAVTFELEAPSAIEFSSRIRDISTVYPYLVYEQDGELLGYAYAHRYRERAAFDFDCELSVYVRMDKQHCGIGRALYSALLPILRAQRFQLCYSLISVPNEASVALHERFGFVPLAKYSRCGYKLDAWRDLLCMELALGKFEASPPPVIPIGALDQELLANALRIPFV